MAFIVFADGSANLPKDCLEGITLLPCSYCVDGVQKEYQGDIDSFDVHHYYDSLRGGAKITTSLLNTHLFLEHFREAMENGQDVVYVSMSSGISGTYQAAVNAKHELEEEYPDRYIHIRESGALLDADVPHMCQYFTVDDLNFLKRSGRVSGATAMIGTVLNIKPILYGDATGHIVSCAKVRGRKKAIDAIVEKYAQKQLDAEHRIVAISHGDCPEDAEILAEKVRAVANPGKLVIVPHEPFSGAHVGPGMLALFFYGSER